VIRLLNLLRNEYQKVFTKKGTYVMLALVLVIAGGFQFLLSWVNRLDTDNWVPDREEIESDLEWYREMAADEPDSYYVLSVKLYEAMLEYEIYDADYWGTQSWQGEALNTAYFTAYSIAIDFDNEGYTEQEKAQAQETFDAIISAIKADDFTAYCKAAATYSDRCQAILDLGLNPETDSWKLDLIDDYVSRKDIMEYYKNLKAEDYDDTYYNALASYELINYRLANNVQYCVTDNTTGDSYNMLTGNASPYSFSSDFWSNIYSSSSMITLVTIMVIVIAGGTIASEFSQGTIKFLLLNPVKRGKIYFSKYLTLLTLTALLSAAVFGVIFLANLLSGADGVGAAYLTYSNGKVISGSVLGLAVRPYLYALVNSVVIITMAFMISSFMRNSAVSIGISVGVLLIGSSVTSILAALGLDWGRYLIFANTDLYSIITGDSLFPHHSLTFAIINICAHMVTFLLIGYDGFTRKEV
jgi:ABC-2 type transport system permease protein